jgi:6-pyruvoyltetrahydropterin/6-carboxytetrahydropterin synthase
MFRLTRQVRFAINAAPDAQMRGGAGPTNGYGGFPSLTGLGHFFELDVAVAGELQRDTSYLLNIKDIDAIVRRNIVPMVAQCIAAGQFTGGGIVAREIFDQLRRELPAGESMTVESIDLHLSPFLMLSVHAPEHPMVRLSQKFEFSASHRLHNPSLSEADNRNAFGKCNNPHGHGHNYEVQVTLLGQPDHNGIIVEVPAFERTVDETVIRKFDHKNLNAEVPEFANEKLNPSVENIAMVIFRLLKPKLEGDRAKLASVTVWETPKTWCEYSE